MVGVCLDVELVPEDGSALLFGPGAVPASPAPGLIAPGLAAPAGVGGCEAGVRARESKEFTFHRLLFFSLSLHL